MTPANDVLPFAPQIAGCCLFSLFDVMPWLILIATSLITVGAIVYYLTKRPETGAIQEFT